MVKELMARDMDFEPETRLEPRDSQRNRIFLSIESTITMAAALSALNAKIRSQPVLNYVCSTRAFNASPAPLRAYHR
jgi:hypothetical protein